MIAEATSRLLEVRDGKIKRRRPVVAQGMDYDVFGL